MCKYREQVLGFEAEIGLAQESHHHHVEGIGGGLENCPCKGDCDGSCRDEAFCRKHGLPWTPLGHDHSHEPVPMPAAAGHALIYRKAAPQFHFHADGEVHTHDHDHGHAHEDGHDHVHHPYPHADHPLGPRTLPKVQGRLARREREE